MKKRVTVDDFVNEFKAYGREDNFSRQGLKALFQYLIDLEESLDQEIDLDVIALCCEFTQYRCLADITQDYKDITTLEQLADTTPTIMFNGGIIIGAL